MKQKCKQQLKLGNGTLLGKIILIIFAGKNVYYIKLEKNCYVIAYDEKGHYGDAEMYVRKEDVKFIKKRVPKLAKKYDIENPPEGWGLDKCEEFWEGGYSGGYICYDWRNEIESLQCFCEDSEDKEIEFED